MCKKLSEAGVKVALVDAGRPLAISRRDLIAEGKRADAALDFEDLAQENGLDMGSIARRSAGSWTVTVTAPSGHSAGVGPGNEGAIYELARIIDADVGPRTLAQVLERTRLHAAQHLRQLYAFVEWCGLKPVDRLTDERLRELGFELPESVF